MLLLGRDYPQDLGLAAYGEDPSTAAKTAPKPTGNPARNAIAALVAASGSRVFWILFFTFFVCGLSTNGLIQTHFISLCADFGMQNVEAASVLAMMGAFDFIGTVLSGYLSDKYDNRYLLCWYYGLRGLSLIFLPFSPFSFFGLSIFAVFYGLDWIATVPPTVKLAGKEFGREQAPLVFGWVFAGHQLGAAVAAFGAGVTRDALLSYLPAFYAAGGACLLAAAAVLLIGRGRRERRAEPVLAPA
jgi:predicted MFS family arabinose efflux permease